MPKTVDLQAVGNALETIRQTLTEHPEVRERTAAWLGGDPTDRDLDGLRAREDDMPTLHPIPVRLPEALVARLDALVPLLADEPELATKGIITRSDALRLCVLRGLTVLEAEHSDGHK